MGDRARGDLGAGARRCGDRGHAATSGGALTLRAAWLALLLAAGARAPEPVAQQGALGLADGQFQREASVNEARAMERVSGGDFDGLLLDGPRRLREGAGTHLPLVGVRASSIRDNKLVSLKQRGIVVAVFPDSDTVLAARVFRPTEAPARPAAARDDRPIPEGRTVKAFQFLLDERLDGLPAGAGPLRAALVLFDRRSNAVEVRTPEAAAGPARPKYPAGIQPPARPGAAGPPPYRKRPDSPPLARGAAIALAADAAAGAVLGTFELPVRDRDVVRALPGPVGSPKERAARAAGWADVGDPDASAVVPITLVITGEDDAGPLVVPVRVPVYGRLERGRGGAVGTGYFALDLPAVLGDRLPPQRYAVWAFSGAAISNPAIVTIGARRDR